MKVAIAGGHGKIARLLEELLVKRGDSAIGLIRNPDHAEDLRELGAEPVLCDLEGDCDVATAVSVPGHWLDENGFVHLQGSLHNGSSAPVFTLPANARPKTFRSYVIRCNGAPGVVEISNTDGGVRVYDNGGSCATFAFLDGIDFRPDVS